MQYLLPLAGWLFLAAIIALPQMASADVYRWKDDRGYLHFSTNPPTGVDAKKISTHTPVPGKSATNSTSAKADRQNNRRPQIKRNPDLDTLLKIVLPPNASKREVRDYVQRILVASRDQRTYLASDPQVGMLIEIGPDNVDVLIDVAADGNPWSRYPVEAIDRLATNTDKTEIIEALPTHYYLARVVLHKNWCRDAKSNLLEGMRDYTGYLPAEWIQCVAKLKDPATYPDLKFYLENGWNRHTTYGAIRFLPGIDLDNTLQRAWDNALTKGNGYEVRYLTADTVRTGYMPAMDYVVEKLNDKKALPNANAIALRHLDMLGNNREIREWYTRHRSRLLFDKKNRRFILPK